MNYKKTSLMAVLATVAGIGLLLLFVSSVHLYLMSKSPVSTSSVKPTVNTGQESVVIDTNTGITAVGSRKTTGINSLDLIEQDYKNGNMDLETSLLAKAQFVFEDENLDKKYAGGDVLFEPGAVFYDIKKNHGQLSETAKKHLEQYLKRPDDPDSYLSKIYTEQASQSQAGFKLIDTAQADDRPSAYGKFLVTADKKIKVWYPEITVQQGKTSNKVSLYEEQAKQIVKDLDASKAYTLFNLLFKLDPPTDGKNGGDDKVDIYLVNSSNKNLKIPGGFKALGVNMPDLAGDSSYILINASLSDNLLKATVAHELFHVFQHIYPFDYQEAGDLWWLEATAVWAEEYAYPSLNTEHEYVESFIKSPEQKLIKVGGEHEYGAYLFPFYLTEIYSDDVIEKIFKGMDVYSSALLSINANISGGLKKNWKEFTLWNYNKTPVNYYEQKDGSGKFPGFSSGDDVSWELIKDANPMQISIKQMKALSSQVIDVQNNITNKKIKRIDFTGLNDFNDQSYSGVKAIIYTGKGQSYVEDWSDKNIRSFCLEKPGQDILNVVLIFNNALTDDSLKVGGVKFKIEPKEECEEEEEEEKKQEQVKTVEFYIQQTDQTTAPYVNGKIMNITVVSDGKMTAKGSNNQYQYIGKWRIDYDYKEVHPEICTNMTAGCKSSFEFDLSEAYSQALSNGRGSFTAESGSHQYYDNPSAETCCTVEGAVLCENHPGSGMCDSGYKVTKGELYDVTEDGAKIIMTGSYIYDRNDLNKSIVLQLKKK
ncbi:MAG: DUF6055 domain-containing protein [bacterium]